ncbi:15639_t:CDS:2 [Funneliformis geosporum]|uniref:Delta(14)-sterol reductase ERG24 n=1 Tax=Funneliformis geosporum TaxID=1117311 RepID=A0A9W4WLV4_9GLOM|nr:15639_t:CDS:2 [Funneliformis geosporum]CAI2171156.1 9560_t:CDS:2 [Funneliformis geosporum]
MSSKSIHNPKTTEYEFLGPIGAFLMMTVLPVLVNLLHLGCQPEGCPTVSLIEQLLNPQQLVQFFSKENIVSLFDLQASIAFMGYLSYLLLAWYLIPGRWIEGTQLRNGRKLKYKENGFRSMLLTLFIIGCTILIKGHEPLLFIFDHFIGLMSCSIIVSFLVSLYVYLVSFQEGKLLALGGNSGNIIYDVSSFDIKYFVELRPGITGWIIINIAMAAKQYHELGYVTLGMILVLIFQGWYCIDSVYNEPAVLTTMDITTDGFGWMLSFGNITWVAFLYPLQARYLALRPKHLSWMEIVIIVSLQAIGYGIFRGANNEKNAFRNNANDPKLKYLEYITTESGSKLIISSWWGKARHINYLGDWIMAWAWCLPCGFDDIFPYFYVIYFAVLLVHRELRDEEKCKKKYKKDWDRYCDIVRFKIIPGIY